MIWPFKRKPKRDWRRVTNVDGEWRVTKRVGDFVEEQWHMQYVDLLSGDKEWFPYERSPLPPPPWVPFPYVRVREVHV